MQKVQTMHMYNEKKSTDKYRQSIKKHKSTTQCINAKSTDMKNAKMHNENAKSWVMKNVKSKDKYTKYHEKYNINAKRRQ